VPNHLISTNVEEFPEPFNRYGAELGGRSMLVHKARRIDLECVVRGYLAGSGWKEYQESRSVCGIALPPGLVMADRLDEPIFTPSTKADSGHDRNVTLEEAAGIAGADVVTAVERMSIQIYSRARMYASARGILIADTKFEFGWIGDKIVLIDEVLTPDSSRFWLASEYRPGQSPPSLDKQFVRDYLDATGWDHNPPAPELAAEVAAKTAERYRMALALLFPEITLERYMR
jgi:phosphoribosylaminoimidazole-succinocarboxamide synthase